MHPREVGVWWCILWRSGQTLLLATDLNYSLRLYSEWMGASLSPPESTIFI
jgi:hypothetical protein